MPNTDRDRALERVEAVAELLDSRFRIPGTDIRFGLDAVAGLVPVGGDAVSFLASGALVLTMARHGASPRLVARMLLNIAIDGILGSVPLLGDLFDLAFKANDRNVQLLKEHYAEGRHQGSAWPVVAMAAVGLLTLGVLLAWLLYHVLRLTWQLLDGLAT